MQPNKGNIEAGVVMGADRGIYSSQSYRFHERLSLGQLYSLCRIGRLPSKWLLNIYSLFSRTCNSAALQLKVSMEGDGCTIGSLSSQNSLNWSTGGGLKEAMGF